MVAHACTISTSEADSGEASLSYAVSVRLALATELGIFKSECGEGGHGEQSGQPNSPKKSGHYVLPFHTSLFILRESGFE